MKRERRFASSRVNTWTTTPQYVNKLFTGTITATQTSGSPTEFNVGNYRGYRFTGSGSFVVANDTLLNVELIVVAGGGSGNSSGTSSTVQGGGGGGGVSYLTLDLTPGTYVVTIGAGGVTGNGTNSSFGPIISLGGGAGGSAGGGSNGGSGGGAGRNSSSSTIGAAGTGFPMQGNNGGVSASGNGGGGGGGYGSVGVNGGAGGAGGNGGTGLTVTWTGSSLSVAGGGGGGASSTGAAGSGVDGGGNGGATLGAGSAGTANTGGGGGGGGSDYSSIPPGASGGSGIVIIRYAG